jgi:hypothetical protein
MRAIAFFTVTAALFTGQAPLAQSASDLTPPDGVASAASDAVSALGSAAKDKLLVRDLLGASVTGPDGSDAGTIEDLVVIPGGRVVAAIVKAKSADGERVPIPFAVAKMSRSAGKLGISLPVGLSQIRDMSQTRALAKQVPGLGG